MKKVRIKINRFNPETDKSPHYESYSIPQINRGTVLDALIHIRLNLDSSLAFQYGCRFKHCGLCGMVINGKERMACLTYLENGMNLEPLKNMPVVRDLVVDRQFMLEIIESHRLYILGPKQISEFGIFNVSHEYTNLMRCNDCGFCISVCSVFGPIDAKRGSPYLFVKIGQWYYNPMNDNERVTDQLMDSLEMCTSCCACEEVCPQGVKISKTIQRLKEIGAKKRNGM